jgi:hypothetical protein
MPIVQALDNTGVGGRNFSLASLGTYAARFRVQGISSSVCTNKFLNSDKSNKCTGGQTATPFVGLMLYGLPMDAVYPVVGYTPHGAGADGSGFILWDTAGSTPEKPRR